VPHPFPPAAPGGEPAGGPGVGPGTGSGVAITGLGFAWPDGTPLFDGLDAAFGAGRTGLIGHNGSGKTTLLRLIAGLLRPARGTVRVTGRLGYHPQDLTLAADQRVDEVLGIAGVRAALAAVERGDVTAEHLAAIGDDWDVEERCLAVLDRLGLDLGLDRRIGEVSGGEAVLIGLAAQFFGGPGVLLLDEPTNNLDLEARRRLYRAVDGFAGTLVMVSHDRDLLDRADQIAELRDGGITFYGGNHTAYEEAVAAADEAARRGVRTAEADLRRQRRELIEARIKLDQRVRYGQKAFDNKAQPKIIMNARKRQAQVSAGKHRNLHLNRVEQARERLAEAAEAVREDAKIRIDLPGTAVPAGRDVLDLAGVVLRAGDTGAGDTGAGDTGAGGARVDLGVRGPRRLALIGGNGTGKTTLLRTIAGQVPAAAGRVRVGVPVRYLPQRLDLLDDARTVAENVAAYAPGAATNAVRARLARFLFRGDRADRAVGTLSGGERFRATLAALLLAEPPPQLLLLDEPTNNLDPGSVRELVHALESYRGALIVASHDLPLLRELRPDRWVELRDGALHDIDPQ
jgi:ATPase subunit of ABC transporter with duplicated ATPase domains